MQKLINYCCSKPLVAKYGFKLFVWWQNAKYELKRWFGIVVMLMLVGVTSCNTVNNSPVRVVENTPIPMVSKVVTSKKEATETSYKYKYNVWKNNFYHQPDVHTVYYLIFSDGSFESVDLGKYTVTSVGDTVKVYP